MKHIRANGLEFGYLEMGEGPLVLLLHGFPDTPATWAHQMPALAAAGAGHFPQRERPAEVTRLVLDWLGAASGGQQT